jgi:gluconolactonase
MSTTSAAFVGHDAAFAAVTGRCPRLVRVVDAPAHEGPVYVAGEDALYVSALPVPTDVPLPGSRRTALLRIALDGDRFPVPDDALTTVLADAANANGMTLDTGGTALLIAHQGSRAAPGGIGRLDLGTRCHRMVVDQWRGLRFNSPNDVAVAPDGAIWFTDPAYGFLQGFKDEPQLGDFVYRHHPASGSASAATGSTDVVADGFAKPNGICFSTDHTVAYVTDSGACQAPGEYRVDLPHHVEAFDVVDGRRLTSRRLVAVVSPGFPDGIAVDAEDRIYVSCASGVLVLSPDGHLLGEIELPGTVTFCFGGPDRNVLFLTTDTAVWAAVLDTKGA